MMHIFSSILASSILFYFILFFSFINSFFSLFVWWCFPLIVFFPENNFDVHYTKKIPCTKWYISALWRLLWLLPNNLFNLDGRHWQKRHKINAFGCCSKRFLSMDNGIIHQIALHFFLLTFTFVVCKIIFRNSFSFSLALFLLFVPFLAIEWCVNYLWNTNYCLHPFVVVKQEWAMECKQEKKHK